MKDIHKYVKDVEVKKKLKDIYGIGTEATSNCIRRFSKEREIFYHLKVKEI